VTDVDRGGGGRVLPLGADVILLVVELFGGKQVEALGRGAARAVDRPDLFLRGIEKNERGDSIRPARVR